MLLNFFLNINLNSKNKMTNANIIIIEGKLKEEASGEITNKELIIKITPVDKISPNTTGLTPSINA